MSLHYSPKMWMASTSGDVYKCDHTLFNAKVGNPATLTWPFTAKVVVNENVIVSLRYVTHKLLTILVSLPTRTRYGQNAAKRQAADVKFTHRARIRFFRSQGRLVAPIHVKLDRTDEHLGAIVSEKVIPYAPREYLNAAPKIQRNSIFWVKNRPVGANPLAEFQNLKGLLYAERSYVSVSNSM